MITIIKEFRFEAAHKLPKYKGPCANLHGHSYRLLVGVSGNINPETGMVLDFKILKEMIEPIVDLMDHSYLNGIDKDDFPCSNPTAERMVEWIVGNLLASDLENKLNVDLEFIRLYETATSYAEWRA